MHFGQNHRPRMIRQPSAHAAFSAVSLPIASNRIRKGQLAQSTQHSTDWGLDDIGPDTVMTFAGALAYRQLLLDDWDDLVAFRREFRRSSSHLTGVRAGVFSLLCAHAHRRCTRVSSIAHVNGIELLQNVGQRLTFGGVAYKHGERSSAFAQVGVIPAAVVLWYVTSEKPIPEALMALARRSASVGTRRAGARIGRTQPNVRRWDAELDQPIPYLLGVSARTVNCHQIEPIRTVAPFEG
jgi:hypothetical protein